MSDANDWLFREPLEPYGGDQHGNRSNPVLEKSFAFAVRTVKFVKGLREAGWVDLARQLFRSGTSIGANIHETQHPSSRADFIHKMRISEKEAGESNFWLKLCKECPELPYEEGMLEDLGEVRALLYSIIRTSEQNR
jgi:four helix bundle protein